MIYKLCMNYIRIITLSEMQFDARVGVAKMISRMAINSMHHLYGFTTVQTFFFFFNLNEHIKCSVQSCSAYLSTAGLL